MEMGEVFSFELFITENFKFMKKTVAIILFVISMFCLLTASVSAADTPLSRYNGYPSLNKTTDRYGNFEYEMNMVRNLYYQKYYNDYGYGYGGDSYMLDRTFIKLRNISLTWDLPKKYLRHFRSLSLTAFANNLFMWTARDNYYVDPESSTTGIDLAGMFGELYTNPSCRMFGCNLSLKF